jgi:hypothetical protein
VELVPIGTVRASRTEPLVDGHDRPEVGIVAQRGEVRPPAWSRERMAGYGG